MAQISISLGEQETAESGRSEAGRNPGYDGVVGDSGVRHDPAFSAHLATGLGQGVAEARQGVGPSRGPAASTERGVEASARKASDASPAAAKSPETIETGPGKKKGKKKRHRPKKKGSAPPPASRGSDEPERTCTIILGGGDGDATKVRTIVVHRDASRNVARAAGVDWGVEEPTPRMAELQRRHDAIVDVAEAGKLTLLHIKEHNEFLAQLTRQIADEGEHMKRKFRLANAKQLRSSDSKRAAAHQAQAAAIQRRQKRYNNEVAMAQCEVDWLRNSPAYTQAMEFLDEHWIKTAKGDYVSKKDLSDDMSTSFEDLLLSMKMEAETEKSSPTAASGASSAAALTTGPAAQKNAGAAGGGE
mmetsp:Transcript_63275/g.142693  ORF Transcript_63275/g.142693 Transcript_63275/m.142693 type:complete len:360 (-) Transcript_63275:139-1218(-)|eukprot:CAMPEP_0172601298 /NCGR_PEP_ID=MMETSP1068-20121228/21442_1 /TAXON_ID=35684 /ORGANISM="Pseudopedinella elastica, Strain CCMP716" /LENGTH=359 /DNA_ID=CAMNT_0013402229 /DNA_START=72 /DNA_END=1151 /DNA_ORIENTATION=+